MSVPARVSLRLKNKAVSKKINVFFESQYRDYDTYYAIS
jgi:hypothetical protein